MASQCNFPLTLFVLLLSVCLVLPAAFGQCTWSQVPCGPIASYVVRFGHEQYGYPEQTAILVNNATGVQPVSNCGVIYFSYDMAGVPSDLCQDNYGRVVKHLPMAALQSVLTTLQSTSYNNYIGWDAYSGTAFYNSVAPQGAAVGSPLAV
ncbi:Ubiquitin-like domain-containing protein [Pandoravirus kuranda]|uniref:Ubiquitin-like domain-containing protein n=1 Tax=Pandoravirus kuranda TaxID=3019033 RepID=A0AA95ED38_9VIRU|nr:Ubiquitin-like domain-containing protein [Pandoravirus kuranda]